jgi:hypothetical protein
VSLRQKRARGATGGKKRDLSRSKTEKRAQSLEAVVFPAPVPEAFGQFEVIVVMPNLVDREPHTILSPPPSICPVMYDRGRGEAPISIDIDNWEAKRALFGLLT